MRAIEEGVVDRGQARNGQDCHLLMRARQSAKCLTAGGPTLICRKILIPRCQNILISEASLLKIADLGISQVLDSVFTRALVRAWVPCCT